MQYEKVFDVTVNVANPINFCADKDRHLMAELRNTYEGRCYKGAFIIEIKSIIRQGACHVQRTNGSGGGYIDVHFLAEVTIFSSWDILTGVEVVSHQQMVVGIYKGAPDRAALVAAGAPPSRVVVILSASKAVETIAVKQLIPVRVSLAQHPPMQSQAAVFATLLVCDQAAPAYRLAGEDAVLDAAAGVALEPMLAAVDRELAARAELVATRRADLWFFELLLHAHPHVPGGTDQAVACAGGHVWDGPPTPAGVPAGAPAQNVLDLVRRVVAGESVRVAGTWSRPLALYRSSPLAAVAARAPPAGWAPAVDSTAVVVFAEFLKNILDFLAATRELTEVYHTRELIGAHMNIWSVMRAAQRPPQ